MWGPVTEPGSVTCHILHLSLTYPGQGITWKISSKKWGATWSRGAGGEGGFGLLVHIISIRERGQEGDKRGGGINSCTNDNSLHLSWEHIIIMCADRTRLRGTLSTKYTKYSKYLVTMFCKLLSVQ